MGKDGPRLPNTSCLLTPGWKGETQVMALDLAGFAVSSGSACSSGKVRASGALQAMGVDAAAANSAPTTRLLPFQPLSSRSRGWQPQRARFGVWGFVPAVVAP